MSTSETVDHNAVAEFLFLLCPDSIKIDTSTEFRLDSPESFAFLLYRCRELFRQVEEARVTGNFDQVWERCLRKWFQNFHVSFVDSSNLYLELARPPEISEFLKRGNEVPKILRQISENLRSLVNGAITSPLWTLKSTANPDVVKLDLTSVHVKRDYPQMLLYNLGCFEEDPVLKERLRYIYSKNQDTFLVNSSATGKTRLLFEGLLLNWGLYFTAHTDIMEATTLDTTLQYGFLYECVPLPQASALSFKMTLDKNREAAQRRFTIVLLVHLFVFRDFLKTAIDECGSVDDSIHRRRWLLAQLHSPCLHAHEDIFSNLLYALEWESSAYVHKCIFKVLEEIKPLLPDSIKNNGLFVVIDEANVAIKGIWCSHEDDKTAYPALEEIITVWKERLNSLDVPITFVVAGTDIPMQYFPSSSERWSSWKWTSNTGGFDSMEVQKNYIDTFLPNGYLETASGRALMKRVWDWCRPRHRLTASFVAMLLEDELAHPHGVLNRYIKGLTKYAVHDTDEYTAVEGPCDISPFFNSIGSIVTATPRVRFTTHQIIFRYIFTGKHSAHFDARKIELVTSGVGQFIDKDMQVISLDEPGPIVAAAMWLSDDSGWEGDPRSLTSFSDFCSYFHDCWPDGDSYSAQSYIALYLAHVFANSRMLNEVFTIPSPPAWMENTSQSANLVMLRKDQEGVVRELVLESKALLPDAPPLGFVATTTEDVFAWLNHERFGAFCLCPSNCGAELIFVLKSNAHYFWVLLRTTGRGAQTSSEIDFDHEFEQLTGKGLFPNTDLQPFSGDLSDAFSSLPNLSGVHCGLHVLRVLASFPSEPELTCDVAQRMNAPPVATLNVKTFESVTESIIRGDLIENLLSSMQDRRSQFTDAMFNPLDLAQSKDNVQNNSSPKSSKYSRSSVSPPPTRSKKSKYDFTSANDTNRLNQ
ncbi:hypothetical protein C0992_003746 [Termitomyces sp. T32_za158]|nr:hypothetical protein C0992_003746 [Termitomyces sp. T32_za158]